MIARASPRVSLAALTAAQYLVAVAAEPGDDHRALGGQQVGVGDLDCWLESVSCSSSTLAA